MLVTCPECGARISSKADTCPKCGFPEAGLLSKERMENYAQGLKRGLYPNDHFYVKCENCDFSGWIKSKPIEVKVVKRGTGYTTRCYDRCPKCGKEVKEKD